ncbi:MAG: hypothetical protein HKN08_09180 [Gammaproteobacteria bacterium]|nr:hypothetical protein [Gammaproteobacteria bacterium]
MKLTSFRRLVQIFIFILFSLSMQSGIHAQEAFPEGEGRQAIFVSCTQCHGLGHLTRVSLDSQQWENAVYDMVARGAAIDINDLDTIKNYLINNLANDR